MTDTSSLKPGLYVVATPIGAVRDLTFRAADILASADIIVAEDTRRLRKLLTLHNISLGSRKVLAYHDHSDAHLRARIVAFARASSVALVSDAGTPLLADPGYDLVRDAAAADADVVAVPGASALLAALAVSGLPTDRFHFVGFLPPKSVARCRELTALARIPTTLVFYEGPSRVAAALADMATSLGPDRPAAICRELTKRHEQVVRAPLEELAGSIGGLVPQKGEFVIVVGPPAKLEASPEARDAALKDALDRLSVRDAAKEVAEALDLPRKEVYRRALDLSE